jgi:N-acetylglucosamine-6-phosphate deacetylase
MLAFTARRLLTPDEIIDHAVMVVDDGRVLEIASRADGQLPAHAAHFDFGDAVIVPGYVDLHIHGSGGFDVMDDRPEALPAIERVLARHGVTSYFPTTVTASMESAQFRWAFIWKGRSSAMRGAEFILRRICFRPKSKRLSVSGRRRAGTFA